MQVRHLTIMEATSPKGSKVPFIKIFGKFLQEAGFQPDKNVRLEITPGKIVIAPAPERDRLIEEKAEQIHSLIKDLRGLNDDILDLDDENDGKCLRESHKRTQPVMVG
ncbi:hypothetical protein KAW50_02175 [candidate division WOR-3 bacterium]|nr:hypothetical protein [candidate division WOR-3 bacterium]